MMTLDALVGLGVAVSAVGDVVPAGAFVHLAGRGGISSPSETGIMAPMAIEEMAPTDTATRKFVLFLSVMFS